MKKFLNFLKPSEAFIFFLIFMGIPGFLLIWLIDFEIALWLLIFFITSGYFAFLFGIEERWGETFLNRLRILIGWFFFFIFGCTIFIGAVFIFGGLLYLMFTLDGGSNTGDCAPPNFYDC